MQNAFNLKAPFLDLHGKPIVGGFVTFCEPDTDTETTLIHIYSKTGTELVNPLPLNEYGSFEIQPFVDDGIDYKMIVQWREGDSIQSYTMDSKHSVIQVNYHGITVVDGLPDLRTLDPENGKAVVLGYETAGDFCGPRIFQWKEEDFSENYGTHIRSTLSGHTDDGVWVCEPNGPIDVRWFGIMPNNASHNMFLRLSAIVTDYPHTPVYFPEGDYYLGSSIAVSSVILAENAKIKPFRTVQISVAMTVNNLENRGGKFVEANGVKVLLNLTKGELRTSWFEGNFDAFLGYTTAKVIIFDSDVDSSGSDIEKTGKLIFAYYEIPNNYKFENSLIISLHDKSISCNRLKVGEMSVVFERELNPSTGNYEDVINVYYGNGIFAKVDSQGLISVMSASITNAKISNAGIDVVKFNHARVNMEDNPLYVEANSNISLADLYTDDVKLGDIVFLRNTGSTQIQVVINKYIDLQTAEMTEIWIPVNAGNICAMLCVGEYHEQGAEYRYTQYVNLRPLAGNFITQIRTV